MAVGTLDEAIRTQLNRPFHADEAALRCFLVDAQDGTHWFGTMFDHWVVDGYCIRQWMHRCLLGFMKREQAAAMAPLRVRQGASNILPDLRGLPELCKASAECVRLLRANRRSLRIGLSNPADFSSGFIRSDRGGIAVETLRARARSWGVTVNDLFLAAIARSLGMFTSHERQARRRSEIGMAVAFDMRRFLDVSLREAAGCLLSYFALAVPEPERSMKELAIEIAGRTGPSKTIEAARRAYASLAVARRVWDWWPGRKELLMHKAMATTAGISNVNLTGSWIEQYISEGQLLNYLRVSPTGPVPMIFTPTTLNGHVSVCLTYRGAAFSDSAAVEIAERFGEQLLSE